MSLLDWIVVAAYLAYVVFDGIRLNKASDQVRGYFLANRSLPWWAVGLSVMATQMSAITLVGTTGQAYADGMRFIQFYFGLPLAMIILCVTVVPFFHRADVFTAYEFLERRFDARTRSLTSFFFLMSRGLSCGVIIAAPAVILSIVLEWDLNLTVLAIGLPTVLYTMLGGVQAVTWTDVKQMCLIFVSLGLCVYTILAGLPSDVSVTGAFGIAAVTGHLKTVDFSFSLKETYTFWSGLLGGLFLMLSYFGCDQSQVQRFLTARSINQGRISLLMSAFLKIPLQVLILVLGVLVFVFYHFVTPPLIFNRAVDQQMRTSVVQHEYQALIQDYERASAALRAAASQVAADSGNKAFREDYLAAYGERDRIRRKGVDLVVQTRREAAFNDVNHVFPSFLIGFMPIGFLGLMIAAIFAAAMSSISSELNALATASVMDFYRRHFRREAPESHYLLFSKFATGFWGLMACLVAMYATQLGSLIEVVNRLGSFFYGSVLGVFILAIGIPWATARGAFWGLLAGMISVAVVSMTTTISFLWYNIVGAVAVVVTGLILSVTDKSGSRQSGRDGVRL